MRSPNRIAGVVIIATVLTADAIAQNAETATPSQTQSPTPGVWMQEPRTYRGVKFGAPLEMARKEVHLTGCKSREALRRIRSPLADMMTMGGTACLAKYRIADVDTSELWKFDEKSGLVMVSFGFESGGYSTLRDVFVEKFGQPHSKRTKTFQTVTGAQFENELLDWQGAGTHVALKRYWRKVTEGAAYFFTNAEFEVWMKHGAEQAKKAKDAF